MKKLVMVFALGAMLGSCGGGASSIDVESLDSPCACAEAGVIMFKEGIAMGKVAEDMSAEERKEATDMKEKAEALADKMREIEKKCKGDLNPSKAGDDCDAVKEAKELKKEFRKYF
jgi:Skp family chaperone for outer membrane proteins